MGKYAGFDSIELRKPMRALFDLSHENRLTTRMGRLTPIFITETLPNDTFRFNAENFIRFAPMPAPVMHEVNVYIHAFFVANRLLWREWEKFITGGRLGTETPPVPPNVMIEDVLDLPGELLSKSTLADYIGVGNIPSADAAAYANRTIDTMPFAACYRIWYDYYRDRNYYEDMSEDLDGELLPLPSGTLVVTNLIQDLFTIRTRDWEKEYFTSALPWTQRGNEVLMPLEGTGIPSYYNTSRVRTSAGASPTNNRLAGWDLNVTSEYSNLESKVDAATASTQEIRIENISEVNLTTSNVSINDFRRANALQIWHERNAVAGSRYNESIYAHFARRTSDGRLQMAEYLGGGKVRVKISDVPTTAWSQDGEANFVPPANPTGKALSIGNTNRFTYNCEEHGFIVVFMSVMPKPAYMQGSKRMFFGRNTFLDYPWPTFAQLGEQPVHSYELYTSGTNLPVVRSEQAIFGYQSRYVDWKWMPSTTHGDFKESLDYWHLTRKFSSNPVLGAEFVKFEDALQDRIFAVSGVDTLWCYIYNQCTVKRSLPYFGTPRLQA